jgi:hypothetical protein
MLTKTLLKSCFGNVKFFFAALIWDLPGLFMLFVVDLGHQKFNWFETQKQALLSHFAVRVVIFRVTQRLITSYQKRIRRQTCVNCWLLII